MADFVFSRGSSNLKWELYFMFMFKDEKEVMNGKDICFLFRMWWMYCFKIKLSHLREMKKMKKVLGLLTIAITVFAFATVAIAAGGYNRTTEPEAHAYVCEDKCPLGTIPCPETQIITGIQGDTTTTEEATTPFDYDGKPYVAGGFGTYGYSDSYNFDPLAEKPRNCKFIFDVCSCGAACAIEPGAKMGIQMHIKTQGVYWANPDYISATETDGYGSEAATPRAGKPTVHFGLYSGYDVDPNGNLDPDDGALCRKINPDNLMMPAPYYYDANLNERVAGLEGENVTAVVVRNFGVVNYYRQLTDEDYKIHEGTDYEETKFRSIPSMVGNPLIPDNDTGAHVGPIASAYRVNVLESLEETDYVFTVDDTASALGNCKVWIDIPAMRIDPTIANPKDIVKLQIRLLFNREISGICPECDPPDVCDVMLNIAVICEPEGTDGVVGTEYCMFFPYVLQGIQEMGWATGIAISSREDQIPADAWVEMTLRDRVGNKATYKRTNFGQGLVWAFVLDDEMPNFTGSLVGGATSLQVISNYSMDGYQFLNVQGTFGAGSNARGCKTGQCCPTVWK
jgi:hypothetical protein